MPFDFFPVVLLLVVLVVANGINVIREYERAVVLRLGRLVPFRGPGLIFVIPLIESMSRIDMRTTTIDVPAQDVITHDNVSVKVDAVLYFRVLEPSRVVIEVENYLYATSLLAQTTLRSVCGQATLDQLLSDRERLNEQIQKILNEQASPWGIQVVAIELKQIDLPQEMQRAMARQAEAERDRRAKVIHAEGEFQAATRLSEAAEIMGKHPIAIQLRFLQTMVEISSEHTTTLVLPIPVDLLSPFVAMAARHAASSDAPAGPPKDETGA
ncbi:MAG TPA: slipin family protein [Candidatus Binatia bacterium]|jgi:regulator of protease activity HflC (stomatin/prohibitin superfamily)